MALNSKSICLFFLLLGSVLSATASAKTKVFAGISPGLQYVEEGKGAGPAVELLKVLFAEAKMDYQIELSNWAKAHKSFDHSSQSLIFSISRYPSREKNYQWLLDIGPVDLQIARSKERPDLNPTTLKQLKNYKLAVVRGGTPHHLLKDAGFVEERDFGTVGAPEELLRYLRTGFVEFVFYEPSISPVMLKRYEYPVDFLVPTSIKLPIGTSLWLAASLDFPAPLKQQIQQTHQRLLNDPKYQKLRKAVMPNSH